MRALAVAHGLLGAGCGDVLLIDPTVSFGDEELYTPEGVPELELGLYSEQLYSPYNELDPCPIVYGFQGGTWTMPAVRIRGIALEARIVCTVMTDAMELVGRTEEETSFVLATDGWLEIQTYPIPIEAVTGVFEDLYDQPATLSCAVADREGREAASSVHVLLSEG